MIIVIALIALLLIEGIVICWDKLENNRFMKKWAGFLFEKKRGEQNDTKR